MSADDFDPYYEWLGIPPKEQPASHYRLLGIQDFETNPKVISNAADGRMLLLKTFQTSQHEKLVQRLLNEISTARVCLLDERKRAEYDQQLRLQKVVHPRSAESPKPRTRVEEPAVQSIAPEAPKTPKAGLSAQEPAVQSAAPEAPTPHKIGLSAQEPVVQSTVPEAPKTLKIGLSAQESAVQSAVPKAPTPPKIGLSAQEPAIHSTPPDVPGSLKPEPVTPSQPSVSPQIRFMLIGVGGALVLCILLWSLLGQKKGNEPSENEPALVQIQEENSEPEPVVPAVEETAETSVSQESETLYNTGEKFFSQKVFREAVYWYEKAMEKGSTEAQYKLGICYLHGLGTPENKEKAVEYFTALAQKNHVPAQYELGLCYLKGDGVKQNKLVGLNWLQKAADQGFEMANTVIQEEKRQEEEQRKAEQARFEEEQKQKKQQEQLQLAEKQKADEVRQKASHPGKRMVKVVDGIEYIFHWCPPGTFMMGCQHEEDGYETLHEVTLTKGFWMLETEVTIEMFQSFTDKTGYKSIGDTPFGAGYSSNIQNSIFSWLCPGFDQEETCPVVCVSWNDAVAFCKWLSKETDLQISLPTEAQWEYACRAGTTTTFNFGNTLNGDKANCNGKYRPYGTNVEGKYLKKTVPVRSYKPNAWGLYDMHGNAREWCQDWYEDYPRNSVIDPVGGVNGLKRSNRGGDWNHRAGYCRSAARWMDIPTYRGCELGFRVIETGVEPDTVSTSPSTQISAKDNHKPGERMIKTFKNVEYAFRWCPAGTFTMGTSLKNRKKLINNDNNRHRVTLTHGFWMLETEVTQKMWLSVMKENPSKLRGAARPVENVSWEDCQEFLHRLNISGLTVSLPTEAQWEYACQAGGTDIDVDDLKKMGWYNENADGKTHPVGKKKPNKWGLYDMYGNVWEWCQDWYSDDTHSSVTDPTGPKKGSHRVTRGGSWHSDAGDCRSDYRGKDLVNSQGSNLGFRIIGVEKSDHE